MRHNLFIIVLIMSSILFVSACNDTEEKVEKEVAKAIPVEVADVEKGDFTIEKSVYGNTMPSKQTPIMLEEPGEIITLKVENGDKVAKDESLATIKTPMGSKTIYATTDGKIAQLNAQEESFQSNEDPLLMIVDTETIHASFNVSASVRDLFKKDDTATIFIEEEKHEGTVLAVDLLPDDSGQYPINVALTNDEEAILPGTAAKLVVTDKKVKDTIIVPTDAIITEADDTFVFIAEDDRAKRVKVDIKETQSEQSAVTGDLKKGEQVIVKGQFTLTDDTTIDIQEGNEE